MRKIAGFIVLGIGFVSITGCSSRGNYGSQAYSTPTVGMTPPGNSYQASPANFQPTTGPIASGPGCNCQPVSRW